MSLLRDLLDNPLDAAYSYREEPADPAPRSLPGWRRVVVLTLTVALGAGAVWSARELRSPAGEAGTRGVLAEQISQRQEVGDALSEANAARRAEIDSLSDAALAGVDPVLVEETRLLGVVSGATHVRGPGIVIELSDSAATSAGSHDDLDLHVQDVDLQVLVNGLWASGAEAIAVNGQRLSSTSAIRAAGRTILVNLVPVVSPYRVEVIGDPVDLQTALSRTSAARHLGILRSSYGITSDISVAEDLLLDASATRTLQFAEPIIPDEEPQDAPPAPKEVD